MNHHIVREEASNVPTTFEEIAHLTSFCIFLTQSCEKSEPLPVQCLKSSSIKEECMESAAFGIEVRIFLRIISQSYNLMISTCSSFMIDSN